jgi:nucleoside-diphosphate-sugar epimerase
MYSCLDLAKEQETEDTIRSFAPTLVISIAGWGMSTFDMLSPRCWTINYEGTKTLVNICKRLQIQRFIYTSTYNVAFHGQKIENGAESLPYSPDSAHVDEYSKSKTHAEKFVLGEAVFSHQGDIKNFVTVSLRPGAIYGEDEMRHIPRIVKLMDLWLYSPAQIGTATVDWVHIDNLIQAYEKLADTLVFGSDDEVARINGQAYCINDNDPITNQDFLGPLCRARMRPEPYFTLPISVMLQLSGLFETLYFKKLPTIQLFTRAEIYKAGQTHFFPPVKAKAHFGYVPSISSHTGAQQLAAKYRIPIEQIRQHPRAFRVAHWVWWVLILTGMFLLTVVALEPSAVPSSSVAGTFVDSSSRSHRSCCGSHSGWNVLGLPFVKHVSSSLYSAWLELGSSRLLGFYGDPTSGGIPASWEASSTLGCFQQLLVVVVIWVKALAYAIFRSQAVLQYVLYAACLAHLAESLYALLLARAWCYLGSDVCLGWWLQTLCLGYPSLSLLQEFHDHDVRRLQREAIDRYVHTTMQEKKRRMFGSVMARSTDEK